MAKAIIISRVVRAAELAAGVFVCAAATRMGCSRLAGRLMNSFPTNSTGSADSSGFPGRLKATQAACALSGGKKAVRQ